MDPLARVDKTVAMLVRAHATSAKFPGTASLLVRATQVSLARSTLVTFEKTVAAGDIAAGKVKWYGGSGSSPACYQYGNGSRLYVGGMDRPGAFLSMDLDRVYADEANQLTLVGWETLATRLRGKSGCVRAIVGATNPDNPAHWLYERAGAGKMQHLYSRHEDNPFLYNRDGRLTTDGEDYIARLQTLTGVRRERYLLGRWAASEGQVYDDWSDADNLIDPFDVPAEWRSVWTWDQGFQNPQVFQRWVIDGDGRAYLTHEMSRRQRLVEDFARDILDLKNTNGWRWPEAMVADHDAGDRATMERHLGLTTIPAKKGVARGVQLMQARIRKSGDGKPRLLVFRDALIRNDPLASTDKRPRGFAAEIGGLVWAVERGTDGIPREHPKKENDHSMDAGRYLCMYLDADPPGRIGNPAREQTKQSSQDSPWSRSIGKSGNHP